MADFDQDISQTDFRAILANSKLLRADLPRTDERWTRFYSKFLVVEEAENAQGRSRRRYALIPTLIALITLSQGAPDVKAKSVCELFSG